MVPRVHWTCPFCGRKYLIPEAADSPRGCPHCIPNGRDATSRPEPTPKPEPLTLLHIEPRRYAVRPRKKTATLHFAAAFLVLGGLLAIIVISVVGRGQPDFSSDRELELVRAWLRENLDSGEWEEVRWWPARPRKKKRAKTIAEAEWRIKLWKELIADGQTNLVDQLAELEQYLKSLPSQPIQKAARLKFRTKNQHGAKTIRDVIFYVHKSSVEPIPEDFTDVIVREGDFDD